MRKTTLNRLVSSTQERQKSPNRPHNPEVAGSSPASATRKVLKSQDFRTFFALFRLITCSPIFPDPNADPNGSGERKPSDSTGEDIPHRLGGFQLGVGGDVGVGVQREARRVVTEHTADGLDVHAVLERHCREGVSEVVETYPWEARSFQHPLEHV